MPVRRKTSTVTRWLEAGLAQAGMDASIPGMLALTLSRIWNALTLVLAKTCVQVGVWIRVKLLRHHEIHNYRDRVVLHLRHFLAGHVHTSQGTRARHTSKAHKLGQLVHILEGTVT